MSRETLHDPLKPWFHLKSVPGIGNLLYKRLLDRFRTPEAVLAASEREIAAVEGVSGRLASLIRAHRVTDAVLRELERLRTSPCRVITFNDPDYPELLRHIPDPPPFLYVRGDPGRLDRTVAVVGSRNASRYGLSATRKLCEALAVRDITIVSGMARGIDTAAHMGALAAGGRTIAVLGSGLEKIYPSENRELFHKILESGAVISEFSLKTAPEPFRFPIRNRIISGLSLGTVVVEATAKSGSLITARLAAEQNRDVFAVPGNIQSGKSAGTHRLIKQGAKLVEKAEDILEEFEHLLNLPQTGPSPSVSPVQKAGEEKKPRPPVDVSPLEARVLATLGPSPVHIDLIVRKLDMDSGQVAALLLQLELRGLVVQSPGMRFASETDSNRDGA